jgi:hypothetical protein
MRRVASGEVILRAPPTSGLKDPAGITLAAGKTLASALAAVGHRFELTLGSGGQISQNDCRLAVSLMHALSHRGCPGTLDALLPSTEQLRSLPLFWDVSAQEQLRGTYAGELLEAIFAETCLIRDVVVLPTILPEFAAHFTSAGTIPPAPSRVNGAVMPQLYRVQEPTDRACSRWHVSDETS